MTAFADILSKYRIFPRLFSILFGVLLFDVSDWYMTLSAPTAEQSGWAASFVLAAVGWFKFYVDGGK